MQRSCIHRLLSIGSLLFAVCRGFSVVRTTKHNGSFRQLNVSIVTMLMRRRNDEYSNTIDATTDTLENDTLLEGKLNDGWALPLSRRGVLQHCAEATTSTLVLFPLMARAVDDQTTTTPPELRNRNANKQALVREDYYYMMGKRPPRRLLDPTAATSDPKWNAWGACEASSGSGSGTNSCTYVPLKQRIPAYSKYGYIIRVGLKEYQALGTALQQGDWNKAKFFLADSSPPPPVVDAQLKMVLMATQLLTTPNYTGLSKELLVARFYINELRYATSKLQDILLSSSSSSLEGEQRQEEIMSLWQFGRDSWNSYVTLVNPQISEKVGDKFNQIV